MPPPRPRLYGENQLWAFNPPAHLFYHLFQIIDVISKAHSRVIPKARFKSSFHEHYKLAHLLTKFLITLQFGFKTRFCNKSAIRFWNNTDNLQCRCVIPNAQSCLMLIVSFLIQSISGGGAAFLFLVSLWLKCLTIKHQPLTQLTRLFLPACRGK